MTATKENVDAPLDQRLRAAIMDVKTAFGAPGDWGYDSKEGQALYALYGLFNELVARALIEKMEQPEAAGQSGEMDQ